MSHESKSAAPGNSPGENAIADDAATWVVRRDRGLKPEEWQALAAWQSADPRHATEFAQASETWRKLDAAGSIPGLAAMADAIEARALRRRARRRMLVATSGLLATAAAIAVAFFSGIFSNDPATRGLGTPITGGYQVVESAVRSLNLPDGSVANLNGEGSQIEVDFTPAERRIRLVRGEAHFDVYKDPDRPFLVTVGAVTVRAVGTAFNVRNAAASVEVLVTEGKVQLEGVRTSQPDPTIAEEAKPPTVAVGELAVIETAASTPMLIRIAAATPDEAARMLAWKSIRIAFNETPLDEVVAAFNRYNAHKLVLGDPSLQRRTLTGTFRADNLDGFTRLLESSVDITIAERAENQTVLMPMPQQQDDF